eukprot:gnl/TRDRNA2_/TRDRNA2_171950_c2_seq3.p1 gnl/TRDRNA2_/TRDRNA2_171950_c2~~gnl/TRDRNA2_/TRDRNA2_171950_c2_seq3.p1  ORF type:complete len:291 (-),score=26.99 gnl/TRDRNA2_/TRDRNA2_171950_c2_seq3:52-924(-)
MPWSTRYLCEMLRSDGRLRIFGLLPGSGPSHWRSPPSKVFGREPAGILESTGRSNIEGSSRDSIDEATGRVPPWINEVDVEVLQVGTFQLGWRALQYREATFFHRSSKTLIVTDAVARIPSEIPDWALNDPAKLLYLSKESTDEPLPEDTPEARKIGWAKTALLVSYFFPEHEEPDPERFGVVTWTPGYMNNFASLSGRLLVLPVVRTVLYAQDPGAIRDWVRRITSRWDFERVVPAHWDAPIAATPAEVEAAFRFLDDPSAEPFPRNDLRALQPFGEVAAGMRADSLKV